MPAAIGLIEVEGVAGIIVAADAAVKAAEVELLGWDSIGGFTTVLFSGSISDVSAALCSWDRGGSSGRRTRSCSARDAAIRSVSSLCD